ncbi:MAG: threonylcarbamoyl-AMP synthase [Armatimonadetes bacterium]|nr:threonylcarbamoyl-AMP synthase [Armatimonadota bacterium]
MAKAIIWQVDPLTPAPEIIERAAGILRSGGLVAFPTETVYGLGADAFNPAAVAGIFRVKGRPADNPLILHVADREMVYRLAVRVNEPAGRLMEVFWPGPLTLVLPRRKEVPPAVSAGLETVAVRMPAHQVALDLIRAAGVPVAAPSANLSGRPSPTTAAHVWEDLGEDIDAILDAGPAGIGVESTVVDLTAPVPVVLRPGGVTMEELSAFIGEVRIDSLAEGGSAGTGKNGDSYEKPRSPGLKYRHYAPRASLILVEGDPREVPAKVRELADLKRAGGLKVGILASAESAGSYRQGNVVVAGSRQCPEQIAARLYSALRYFDELSVDVIIAEGVEPAGLGLAVMNRLRRAAAEIIRN